MLVRGEEKKFVIAGKRGTAVPPEEAAKIDMDNLRKNTQADEELYRKNHPEKAAQEQREVAEAKQALDTRKQELAQKYPGQPVSEAMKAEQKLKDEAAAKAEETKTAGKPQPERTPAPTPSENFRGGGGGASAIPRESGGGIGRIGGPRRSAIMSAPDMGGGFGGGGSGYSSGTTKLDKDAGGGTGGAGGSDEADKFRKTMDAYREGVLAKMDPSTLIPSNNPAASVTPAEQQPKIKEEGFQRAQPLKENPDRITPEEATARGLGNGRSYVVKGGVSRGSEDNTDHFAADTVQRAIDSGAKAGDIHYSIQGSRATFYGNTDAAHNAMHEEVHPTSLANRYFPQEVPPANATPTAPSQSSSPETPRAQPNPDSAPARAPNAATEANSGSTSGSGAASSESGAAEAAAAARAPGEKITNSPIDLDASGRMPLASDAVNLKDLKKGKSPDLKLDPASQGLDDPKSTAASRKITPGDKGFSNVEDENPLSKGPLPEGWIEQKYTNVAGKRSTIQQNLTASRTNYPDVIATPSKIDETMTLRGPKDQVERFGTDAITSRTGVAQDAKIIPSYPSMHFKGEGLNEDTLLNFGRDFTLQHTEQGALQNTGIEHRVPAGSNMLTLTGPQAALDEFKGKMATGQNAPLSEISQKEAQEIIRASNQESLSRRNSQMTDAERAEFQQAKEKLEPLKQYTENLQQQTPGMSRVDAARKVKDQVDDLQKRNEGMSREAAADKLIADAASSSANGGATGGENTAANAKGATQTPVASSAEIPGAKDEGKGKTPAPNAASEKPAGSETTPERDRESPEEKSKRVSNEIQKIADEAERANASREPLPRNQWPKDDQAAYERRTAANGSGNNGSTDTANSSGASKTPAAENNAPPPMRKTSVQEAIERHEAGLPQKESENLSPGVKQAAENWKTDPRNTPSGGPNEWSSGDRRSAGIPESAGEKATGGPKDAVSGKANSKGSTAAEPGAAGGQSFEDMLKNNRIEQPNPAGKAPDSATAEKAAPAPDSAAAGAAEAKKGWRQTAVEKVRGFFGKGAEPPKADEPAQKTPAEPAKPAATGEKSFEDILRDNRIEQPNPGDKAPDPAKAAKPAGVQSDTAAAGSGSAANSGESSAAKEQGPVRSQTPEKTPPANGQAPASESASEKPARVSDSNGASAPKAAADSPVSSAKKSAGGEPTQTIDRESPEAKSQRVSNEIQKIADKAERANANREPLPRNQWPADDQAAYERRNTPRANAAESVTPPVQPPAPIEQPSSRAATNGAGGTPNPNGATPTPSPLTETPNLRKSTTPEPTQESARYVVGNGRTEAFAGEVNRMSDFMGLGISAKPNGNTVDVTSQHPDQIERLMREKGIPQNHAADPTPLFQTKGTPNPILEGNNGRTGFLFDNHQDASKFNEAVEAERAKRSGIDPMQQTRIGLEPDTAITKDGKVVASPTHPESREIANSQDFHSQFGGKKGDILPSTYAARDFRNSIDNTATAPGQRTDPNTVARTHPITALENGGVFVQGNPKYDTAAQQVRDNNYRQPSASNQAGSPTPAADGPTAPMPAPIPNGSRDFDGMHVEYDGEGKIKRIGGQHIDNAPPATGIPGGKESGKPEEKGKAQGEGEKPVAEKTAAPNTAAKPAGVQSDTAAAGSGSAANSGESSAAKEQGPVRSQTPAATNAPASSQVPGAAREEKKTPAAEAEKPTASNSEKPSQGVAQAAEGKAAPKQPAPNNILSGPIEPGGTRSDRRQAEKADAAAAKKEASTSAQLDKEVGKLPTAVQDPNFKPSDTTQPKVPAPAGSSAAPAPASEQPTSAVNGKLFNTSRPSPPKVNTDSSAANSGGNAASGESSAAKEQGPVRSQTPAASDATVSQQVPGANREEKKTPAAEAEKPSQGAEGKAPSKQPAPNNILSGPIEPGGAPAAQKEALPGAKLDKELGKLPTAVQDPSLKPNDDPKILGKQTTGPKPLEGSIADATQPKVPAPAGSASDAGAKTPVAVSSSAPAPVQDAGAKTPAPAAEHGTSPASPEKPALPGPSGESILAHPAAEAASSTIGRVALGTGLVNLAKAKTTEEKVSGGAQVATGLGSEALAAQSKALAQTSQLTSDATRAAELAKAAETAGRASKFLGEAGIAINMAAKGYQEYGEASKNGGTGLDKAAATARGVASGAGDILGVGDTLHNSLKSWDDGVNGRGWNYPKGEDGQSQTWGRDTAFYKTPVAVAEAREAMKNERDSQAAYEKQQAQFATDKSGRPMVPPELENLGRSAIGEKAYQDLQHTPSYNPEHAARGWTQAMEPEAYKQMINKNLQQNAEGVKRATDLGNYLAGATGGALPPAGQHVNPADKAISNYFSNPNGLPVLNGTAGVPGAKTHPLLDNKDIGGGTPANPQTPTIVSDKEVQAMKDKIAAGGGSIMVPPASNPKNDAWTKSHPMIDPNAGPKPGYSTNQSTINDQINGALSRNGTDGSNAVERFEGRAKDAAAKPAPANVPTNAPDGQPIRTPGSEKAAAPETPRSPVFKPPSPTEGLGPYASKAVQREMNYLSSPVPQQKTGEPAGNGQIGSGVSAPAPGTTANPNAAPNTSAPHPVEPGKTAADPSTSAAPQNPSSTQQPVPTKSATPAETTKQEKPVAAAPKPDAGGSEKPAPAPQQPKQEPRAPQQPASYFSRGFGPNPDAQPRQHQDANSGIRQTSGQPTQSPDSGQRQRGTPEEREGIRQTGGSRPIHLSQNEQQQQAPAAGAQPAQKPSGQEVAQTKSQPAQAPTPGAQPNGQQQQPGIDAGAQVAEDKKRAEELAKQHGSIIQGKMSLPDSAPASPNRIADAKDAFQKNQIKDGGAPSDNNDPDHKLAKKDAKPKTQGTGGPGLPA